MSMKPIKVTMNLTKSTKGTQVYGEIKDGTPVRSLYIQRDWFDGEPPASIVVEVKPA